MAFADDEKSVSSSAPVELYTFTLPTITYRLTNYDTDFVFGGNTYSAIPMQRTAVEGSAAEQAQEIVVTLPSSTPVVRNHVFGVIPREMFLEVRRVQLVSGESSVVWDGKVTSVSVGTEDGKSVARLRVPSVMDEAMSAQVPSAHYQRLCNHILYDARCRVLRTSFDVVASVTAVSGVTVTVSTVGGNPDAWFRAGEVVRTSDGERRLVTKHFGTTLTLNAPFSAVVLPFAVTLFAGCDHTVHTCRDKFSNVVNFGGHPYISADFVSLSRLVQAPK